MADSPDIPIGDQESLPYPGRITITWPGTDPHGWQTTVHDADTGELLPVSHLRLDLDANTASFGGPITAQALLLVDQDNEPLRGDHAVMPYPDLDNPGHALTRWFCCPVAEMRIRDAEPKP